MKNKYFLLTIILLVSIKLNLVAQQQGFGCVTNKEYISLSGNNLNNSSNSDTQWSPIKPICDTPPFFGKQAKKNGKSLSLPFGIGIYSTYYDQEYTASNLRLIPDSSSLVARADTLYQNTSANEFKNSD